MEKILISDAAKQVQVESHVLRYWEEELHLSIRRNKQGHRYYTKEDVDRFKQIKRMKEQGFQLKAIRSALEGRLTDGGRASAAEEARRETTNVGQEQEPSAGKAQGKPKAAKMQEPAAEKPQQKRTVQVLPQTMEVAPPQTQTVAPAVPQTALTGQALSEKDMKAARLQVLLQHMIGEAVRENNVRFCEDIRQTVAKEMDYQFRRQEEKEEEREKERLKREEEHYKEIDLLLRGKSQKERRKKVFGVRT